jgi:transcription initiation factor IIE alpha subunit
VKETITMSIKDLDRLEVFKKILRKELTQEEAAQILGIGSRQFRKLLTRLKEEGPKGIVSRVKKVTEINQPNLKRRSSLC